MNKIINLLKRLSSLNIFFWSVLWLMIIVVSGTIEQKNIGLFAAQEKYFSSFYFKFYMIPLPGGGTIILLMSLALISQLVFKTNYKSKSRIGITLAHFGALILLLGSFITHKVGTEGSLVFKEGETVDFIQDYKNFDLVISHSGTNDEMKRLGLNDKSKLPVTLNNKFSIIKIEAIKNCQLTPNNAPSEEEVGFAKMFTFSSDSVSHGEIIQMCAEVTIQGQGLSSTYRVFNNMPRLQSLDIGMPDIILEVRNSKILLPFKMQLLDFDKKFHQGTLISKSFKSIVQIHDEKITFDRVIEMNSPLRYKGYTFYQSSFSENSEGEISELAVVKNQAQWFPYISSFILCFGVLLHLVIKSRGPKIVSKDLKGTQS